MSVAASWTAVRRKQDRLGRRLFDQGQRRLKTFAKRDADAFHAQVAVEIGPGIHSARPTTIAEAAPSDRQREAATSRAPPT